MTIILYNPLSRNGKAKDVVKKIEKKLNKQNEPYKVYDIIKIKDVPTFIKLTKTKDKVIIVGGDGTINRLANALKDYTVLQEAYLYKAGTGNDFGRSFKGKYIHLNPHLKNLPVVTVNQKHWLFVNGCGMGLDGMVCYKVGTTTKKKNARNYFKNAIRSFMTYQPVAVDITIDGQKKMYKKTWLVAIMNGPYFGGGMKIAPKAKRDDDVLDVIIVHSLPRWLLLIIFPTIYFGFHTIFKPFVDRFKAQDIKVVFSQETYAQIDGEYEFPVKEVHAVRYETKEK